MKLLSTSILAALSFAVSAVHADGLEFSATLSGAQEVPAVDTDASGRINARFDSGFTKVRVDVRINGLAETFAAAHLHCNRAGANGPVPFGLINPGPLSFDGRRIRGVLTNADFTGSDCVGATGRPINNIASLAFAMRDGLIYLNVHSSDVPSGELRGQLLEADNDDDSDSDSDSD